jgi:hypothetical protein
VPMANACNPSYSRGRDQEDHGTKPAQANSSQDPVTKIKKNHKKRAGRVAQGTGLDFKHQWYQKKKKERKEN